MRNLLAVFFLACLPCSAGPRSLYLSNAWHYAARHKAEMLVDLSMVLTSAADVESTSRAINDPCRCFVESNPWLPARPSRAQLWGVKVPFIAGLAVINHFTANARNDNGTPIFPYGVWAIPSAGWDVSNILAARHNLAKLP